MGQTPVFGLREKVPSNPLHQALVGWLLGSLAFLEKVEMQIAKPQHTVERQQPFENLPASSVYRIRIASVT
jgi:hypothetical protein